MEQQNHLQISAPVLNWAYRGRALANIFRMGHCAPAVMQTILDLSRADKEWLVKLSAGMPGGIGNTGFECGALTSPLVLLGLHYGLGAVDGGLPVLFDRGHALRQNFLTCHQTLNCREIRGKDRFPRHCLAPVMHSPEHFTAALDGNSHGNGHAAIPEPARTAYARLYAHLFENDFHCAQAVFAQLGYDPAEQLELYAAASAFMGGTLFMGKTCGAFVAGVMAIGFEEGEIENSIPRVVRLLAIMTAGGNAFEERLNKFNRSMNRGYRLSRWFAKEFGSTQCRAITGCDFSDPAGVGDYVESNRIAGCREMAEKVAGKIVG